MWPIRPLSTSLTSTHFFHHLTPEQNVEMLREALRVARRGVIVNDTRRHYIPFFVVRVLAAAQEALEMQERQKAALAMPVLQS